MLGRPAAEPAEFALALAPLAQRVAASAGRQHRQVPALLMERIGCKAPKLCRQLRQQLGLRPLTLSVRLSQPTRHPGRVESHIGMRVCLKQGLGWFC